MNMVKHKKLLLLSVLSTFVLASCGYFTNDNESPTTMDPIEEVVETPIDETDEETPTENPDNVDEAAEEDAISQELSAWFPRLENVVYTYEGTGNEYAAYSFNPQFNQEDYYQIVTNNGGTVYAEVFEYRENEIVRTFQLSEVYYRDNFTTIGTTGEDSSEEVLLQLPIKVGTNWTGEEATYEITAVDHEIDVPAGTYETIEVTITYPESTTKRYYAQDVGLVYEIHDMGDFTVESSLSSIQTDTPESLLLSVYVPDEQALGLDVVNTELVLPTNEPARLAIQEMLSGENQAYPNVNLLPEDTEINYLFKNDNGIVEVDLSSEFVSNMNAGATGEVFYLTSLTNTLLEYYGAEELLLTIDGENYESGHIILMDGETVQFDHELVND